MFNALALQRTVDGGEREVFRRGVEATVANIVPDALQVFLFNKTGVVFLAGSGTGEGDTVGIAPGKEEAVDKFAAIIAINAQKGEREAGPNVRKGFYHPFLDFIEEGTEFDPPGSDIGGVQGEAKLPRIPLPAVMDGVGLEKPSFRWSQG
jgi:hypothetical protein